MISMVKKVEIDKVTLVTKVFVKEIGKKDQDLHIQVIGTLHSKVFYNREYHSTEAKLKNLIETQSQEIYNIAVQKIHEEQKPNRLMKIGQGLGFSITEKSE